MIIQLVVDGTIYQIPAEAQQEIAAMFMIESAASIASHLRAMGCVPVGKTNGAEDELP